jgi:hypothetical protein
VRRSCWVCGGDWHDTSFHFERLEGEEVSNNKPALKDGQVWHLDGRLAEVTETDGGHAWGKSNGMPCHMAYGVWDYIGEIPKPEPKVGERYVGPGGQEWIVTGVAGRDGNIGNGVVIQRTLGMSFEQFAAKYRKL